MLWASDSTGRAFLLTAKAFVSWPAPREGKFDSAVYSTCVSLPVPLLEDEWGEAFVLSEQEAADAYDALYRPSAAFRALCGSGGALDSPSTPSTPNTPNTPKTPKPQNPKAPQQLPGDRDVPGRVSRKRPSQLGLQTFDCRSRGPKA